MHYSSDTYVLYDLGYMAYPEKYFLLDGRLISAIVCYIAGILHIPIKAYIIGMDFIGIIFIGTAIYTISKIFEKLIKPKSQILKLSITLASFILILNQFTLEYLLFPESAVMCFGLFLNVLAVKIMIENPKHKYLKIFILLLLAGISYQGLFNIFPILAMTTYLVKEITEDKPYKEKEKEFFIEMIKLAIIVMLALLICMEIIKIGTTMLNSKQDRRMHLISFEAVLIRGKRVEKYLNELWNECMAMLPKHTNTITLIISFILLLINRTKKEYIMQYILIIFIAFLTCTIPMFLFNTGVCGRVNVPLMMLWGTSLIILLAQASISPRNKINNIIYIFTIISFIINSIFIMQNITEHIAANRVDENTGKTISYLMKKYEEETGKTITKLSFTYDKHPQRYAVGIKPMQSLTERKFACPWCIKEALNYYCNKNLKPTAMSMDIKEKLIDKDYKEFTEEQLIFDEDTLYMIIY